MRDPAVLVLPLAIDPAHPAFAGHFPAHPIVPGAVLLDHGLAAIARARGRPEARWSIAQAKFLSPVTPGEALRLDARADVDRYTFEVLAGDEARVAMRGQATLEPEPGH